MGYAAYDLVRYYERLPSLKPDDLGLPDLLFVEPEVVAVFDHLKNLLHLVAPGRDPEEAEARLFWAERRLKGPLPGVPGERAGGRGPLPGGLFPGGLPGGGEEGPGLHPGGGHLPGGPLLEALLPLTVHPFALYRALRSVNPSPYMGYLDLGEVVLVSASPESLLRSDGRRVVTRPIAGTRPRGKDEEEDKRLAEELLRDEKEVAEHVMLLDLSRNDIGRVAAFGTVRVLEPLHVEHYSHVMHLVSTVEGILAEGKTPLDALASVLPMGTVSGAPKIRAMEIIEELEPHRRGPYGEASATSPTTGPWTWPSPCAPSWWRRGGCTSRRGRGSWRTRCRRGSTRSAGTRRGRSSRRWRWRRRGCDPTPCRQGPGKEAW